MATHKSAVKRARQTIKKTAVNRNRVSRVRTYVRKVEEAIKTYQQIVEAPTTSSGGSNTNANANAVPVHILRNMATLRISVLRTASRKDPAPRIPGAQP
jgi:ribosomal protein S20